MSDLINWQKWHDKYKSDDNLKNRLLAVQKAIKSCLPKDNNEIYTILDLGAGDGRDIAEALKNYPKPANIQGLLVEIDEVLAAQAMQAMQNAELTNLKVIVGDASSIKNSASTVPVDLVLLCGIVGNISDEDVEKAIKALPMLLKPGGKVIWTRNRREPDKTPVIRELLKSNDLDEVQYIAAENSIYGIGV